MIHVDTGSRLHFGLFRLPGQSPSAARQFGGVGLMVEQPGLAVRVQSASEWSVVGSLQERARILAARIKEAYSLQGAFAVQVASCPPEHMGLGTGTQLSLAIALALTRAAGQEGGTLHDLLDLAQRLGRGQRSAIGIHGFMQGGFLVEAGKGPLTAVSPLVARAEFPQDWRVLVILPSGQPGCHGPAETQAFVDLANRTPTKHQPEAQAKEHLLSESECDALCRLTLLGMLPALHEADLPAFGETLYEFNCRVGEMFRPAQGGIYSHGQTAEIVQFLRHHGVQGAGQSSWGPTVFAVAEADRAEHLAKLVRHRFGLQDSETIVTRGRNRGAGCV